MARRVTRFGGKSASKSLASAGDAPSSGAGDVTMGWVTLLTGLAVSGFLLWRNQTGHMRFHEFNVLNTALVLWIPLVIGTLFLNREPTDLGFTTGDTKSARLMMLLACVLMTGPIVFFAKQPSAQNYYLWWLNSSFSLPNLMPGPQGYIGGQIMYDALFYHQIVMGFYMFGWEWYHRGFLLTGLKKIMPIWAAVLIQALLFTALHYGKPPVELALSFVGAIAQALVALRYRSFLPCFVLHFWMSACNDFAVLYWHFH